MKIKNEILVADVFINNINYNGKIFSYFDSYTSFNINPRGLGDVNGDGKDDVIIFANYSVYVALSTGTEFTSLSSWLNGDFCRSAAAGGWISFDAFPRVIGDVNGDGKADIVGFGDNGVFVSLSTGSSFLSSKTWSNDFGHNPGNGGWTSFDTFPRALGDVNGDGRADIVGFGNDKVYVSLSTGSSFAGSKVWTNEFSCNAGWTSFNTYPKTLGDVNGDKKADIVGFYDNNVYVSLSTGSTFTEATSWTTEFSYNTGWTSFNTYPRVVGDINGDSAYDLVGFGVDNIYISLSNKSSFSSKSSWTNQYTYNTGCTSFDAFPRLINDITGDKIADVIVFDFLNPTSAPTNIPTTVPTILPTTLPTILPSIMPTIEPTVPPTTFSTSISTSAPTSLSSVESTVIPTVIPTLAPTASPSTFPTSISSSAPTSLPSIVPTVMPTKTPISLLQCPVGEVCTNINNIFNPLTQKTVDLCVNTYNSTSEKIIPINMDAYNPRFKKTVGIDRESYNPQTKKTIELHMAVYNPQKEKAVAIELSTYDSAKYKLYNPSIEKVVNINMMTFDPAKYTLVDKFCPTYSQNSLSENNNENSHSSTLNTKNLAYLRGLSNSELDEHATLNVNDLSGNTVNHEHFEMN